MPNLKEYMYRGVTLNADVRNRLISKWHSITRMWVICDFKNCLIISPTKMASKWTQSSFRWKGCFSRSIKYLFLGNERLYLRIYLAHIWCEEKLCGQWRLSYLSKVLSFDSRSDIWIPSLVLALEDSDIFIKQFLKTKYIQL